MNTARGELVMALPARASLVASITEETAPSDDSETRLDQALALGVGQSPDDGHDLG